jgi:hypothetical protein
MELCIYPPRPLAAQKVPGAYIAAHAKQLYYQTLCSCVDRCEYWSAKTYNLSSAAVC